MQSLSLSLSRSLSLSLRPAIKVCEPARLKTVDGHFITTCDNLRKCAFSTHRDTHKVAE